MKLKNANAIVYGMTALALLFVGVIFAFVIAPTFAKIRDLGRKIALAQTELQAQYENRKKLLSVANDIRDARETAKDFVAEFVPAGHELDFITAVESVASRNEVQERLRLTDATIPGAPEIKVGFELALNGPYHRVLQTIVELERMPKLVLFKDVSLRPGRAAAGQETAVGITLHGAIAAPPRGL